MCSLACVGKASAAVALVGRESANWEGGAKAYRGPGWAATSERVREAANWTCQDCGRSMPRGGPRDAKLHVHHLTRPKEWDRPGSANDEANLVALCPGCHNRRHGRGVKTHR